MSLSKKNNTSYKESTNNNEMFTHYKPITNNNYIKQPEKTSFDLKKKLLSSGYSYSNIPDQTYSKVNITNNTNSKLTQSQLRTSNNKSIISNNNTSFNNSQFGNQSYITTNPNQNILINNNSSQSGHTSNINNFLNASKSRQPSVTLNKTNTSNTFMSNANDENDFKDKILKNLKQVNSTSVKSNYISNTNTGLTSTQLSNSGINKESTFKSYLNNDHINTKTKQTMISSTSNENNINAFTNNKQTRNQEDLNNYNLFSSNTTNYITPNQNIPNVNVNVSHIRIDLNDKKLFNSSNSEERDQARAISNPKLSRPETKQSSYNKANEDVLLTIETNLNNLLAESKGNTISSNTLKDDYFTKEVKKFSLIKKYFEDVILAIPEYGRLLKKLSYGYNESMQNIFQGYLMLKEKKFEAEEIAMKYNNLNKKYNESLKIIKEYKDENSKLKSRNEEMDHIIKSQEQIFRDSRKNESKKSLNNKPFPTEDTEYNIKQSSSIINIPNVITGSSTTYNNLNTEESGLNDYAANIRDINKKLVNDLEALYFPDKVKTRSKSIAADKVPKLDFNFSGKEQNKSRNNIPNLNIGNNINANNNTSNNISNPPFATQQYPTGSNFINQSSSNVVSTLSKIKNLKTHYASSNYNSGTGSNQNNIKK